MSNPKPAVVSKEYKVFEIHEIAVDWNGWLYHVIYGKRETSWFIAIPCFEFSVESSDPMDVLYNTNKIRSSLKNIVPAEEIAKCIKKHWEEFGCNA